MVLLSTTVPFWSQYATGAPGEAEGGACPMPYTLAYELNANLGHAITLGAAENQAFDGDEVLTDVIPWRWMLGVSNVTNTTVKKLQ